MFLSRELIESKVQSNQNIIEFEILFVLMLKYIESNYANPMFLINALKNGSLQFCM